MYRRPFKGLRPLRLDPIIPKGSPLAIRLSLHDSIHLVHAVDWDAIVHGGSPYLLHAHLSALEDAMEERMAFRYAVFHDAHFEPLGVAAFQVLDLEDNGSGYGPALRKFGSVIGSRIVKELKVRSLLCGNAFHCGDHGAHFRTGVPIELRHQAVEMAMEHLRTAPAAPPRITALIWKDVPRNDNVACGQLEARGYHPLRMDQAMMMDVDSAWHDLDGYQAALTAKARTRARAILDRTSDIRITDLSSADVAGFAPVMQRQFEEVVARAPFVFGHFQVSVYAPWKELHGDRLRLRGLWLNDELVGFHAAFVVGDALDAQYVGIAHDHDRRHMLYQRVLLDVLDLALQLDLKRIHLGRTAEQAKSALGALPVDLLFHVKHRDRMANRLLGPFLRSVRPSGYEQRSPFRKGPVK